MGILGCDAEASNGKPLLFFSCLENPGGFPYVGRNLTAHRYSG